MTTTESGPTLPGHTLRYRSARGEVWRWYWRMWARRYGAMHLVMAVLVAFAATGGHSISRFLWAIVIVFPLIVVVSAAFPQLVFKPKERTLVLSEEGWSTVVGKQAGERRWAQVERIEETGDGLIILGKEGNAMIVPPRAFDSDAQRSDITADVLRWFSHAR